MIYRFRSGIFLGLALLIIIGFCYGKNYIEREGIKAGGGVVIEFGSNDDSNI